jgi:isomaltose glucohydrolase
MSAPAIADVTAASLRLITSLQDPSGAYPASPTFSAYRGFSWFRDGSFIADAASAGGETASAEAFFDWCARVVVAERGHIERIVAAAAAGTPVADDDMLPTRYLLDGRANDDDWWDFQLDGFGTWIWAVGAHLARVGGDGARWAEGVALSVDYLVSSWRRPCFDWWEEHSEAVHVSTLGCIAAGLRAAAALPALDAAHRDLAARTADEVVAYVREHGVRDGRLVKWIGDERVDASLAAIVGQTELFAADDPIVRATLERIESELTVDGGVHRFLDDEFYGGGRWPLLSCMLGLAWLRVGDRARARELWDWAVSTATAEGDLPEQVQGHLFHPEELQVWIDRWGTAATPLVWSHAMVVRLAVALEAEGER